MKSVLISIQPKWCELIASGIKTVEVRKTRPKIDTPFKVYIYCTQDKNFNFCTDDGEQYTHIGNGKVIGEFVCDKVYDFVQFGAGIVVVDPLADCELIEKQDVFNMTCLTEEQICDYIGTKDGYCWHISDLVIYDKPKELSKFSNGSSKFEFSDTKDGFPLKLSGMTRPPQSWCYVESEGGK